MKCTRRCPVWKGCPFYLHKIQKGDKFKISKFKGCKNRLNSELPEAIKLNINLKEEQKLISGRNCDAKVALTTGTKRLLVVFEVLEREIFLFRVCESGTIPVKVGE